MFCAANEQLTSDSRQSTNISTFQDAGQLVLPSWLSTPARSPLTNAARRAITDRILLLDACPLPAHLSLRVGQTLREQFRPTSRSNTTSWPPQAGIILCREKETAPAHPAGKDRGDEEQHVDYLETQLELMENWRELYSAQCVRGAQLTSRSRSKPSKYPRRCWVGIRSRACIRRTITP